MPDAKLADDRLVGTYRIATAPEPNPFRPTSFKSTCFESPVARARANPDGSTVCITASASACSRGESDREFP
jgi:hypothetical protein